MRRALRAAFLVSAIPIGALALRDAQPATRSVSTSGPQSIVFEMHDRLWMLDTDSRRLKELTAGSERQERMPALSPDGLRVAYVDYGEAYLASEIVILDLASGRSRRLTENSIADVEPTWSPDGSRLAWIQDGGDGADLVVADENGTILSRASSEELGLTGIATPAWSPSAGSRALAFSGTSRDRTGDGIYLYDLETRHLDWLAEGRRPVWSPDGRELVLTQGAAIARLELDRRDVAPREIARDATSWVERLWWSRSGPMWLERSDSLDESPGEPAARIAGPAGTVVELSSVRSRGKSPAATAALDPRCQVDTVVLEDKFSSWVQFKATLKGNCGLDPTTLTRTGVQYFVDGVEMGYRLGVHPPDWECRNTSGLVSSEGPSVQWFFPTTGGHTIGARVVEWFNEPHTGRTCEAFSNVVARTVNISIPAGDSDADGISNAVENSLIGHFHPTFKLDPGEPSPQTNLESVTVRVGPLLERVAIPIRSQILMNYNVLWYWETGTCVTVHRYDTEPMGYLVLGGSKPYATAGWSVSKTTTIAHDGTPCERTMTGSGYVDPVYVGQGKHGNFLVSDCSDWLCCNRCSAAGPALVYTPHQVGNGKNYPGNCGHNWHLVNGSYLVPEKWQSLDAAFGGLFSPFPP